MSDPIYRPPIDREQERIDIPLDDPNALEPVAPPQEPLFNKKAMVLWALGAFIVWFMVTQSVPIAKRAAREAIIQRIQEAETNTGRHITPMHSARAGQRRAPRETRRGALFFAPTTA